VVNQRNLEIVTRHAGEILIHAADVEGLCRGIDSELVEALGRWSSVPCTYAGGANDIADLDSVERLSNGRIDLTYGSALDLFGGARVAYADCLAWNRSHGQLAAHPT
jgi:phosphoribosylformimino-5-aminoimidazole carboxamide ribotide isomerase